MVDPDWLTAMTSVSLRDGGRGAAEISVAVLDDTWSWSPRMPAATRAMPEHATAAVPWPSRITRWNTPSASCSRIERGSSCSESAARNPLLLSTIRPRIVLRMDSAASAISFAR